MTSSARELLAVFDTLAASDKQQVVVEILRRSTEVDELTDDAFTELAGEVFQGFDVEAANGAEQQAR